jgi:hypothetical protein
MAKQANGFLAPDGAFFETEPECIRYECEGLIRRSCESHGINARNFFELLHEWNGPITEYYRADSQCIEKRATSKGRVELRSEEDIESEPLSRAEDDNPYTTVGVETDAGILELPLRRHERVPDIRSGTRTEAVPPAREGFGS